MSPPEASSLVIYPAMPPTTCTWVGPPPVTDDDKVLAEYINRMWDAYQECFSRLGKVHETVTNWKHTI
ncbi:MAG: hypothetical protein BGO00_02525 [Alphaproteobacteria bacterium 62-8]|nr:MAG: hypothetical protein BGO00_02525 [Alphaproteobacteria bacterium 62-8]